MADDKISCGDDVITRKTPEFVKIIELIRETSQITDRLMNDVRPCLFNERYFTTEQIMKHFHISRRALQNYRDRKIISFFLIGGTILYPESKLNEVLEKNYFNPYPKII